MLSLDVSNFNSLPPIPKLSISSHLNGFSQKTVSLTQISLWGLRDLSGSLALEESETDKHFCYCGSSLLHLSASQARALQWVGTLLFILECIFPESHLGPDSGSTKVIQSADFRALVFAMMCLQ